MVEVITEIIEGRNKFQVVVNRSLFGQRFHARVLDLNGRTLMSSEKYRNRRDAEKVIARLAE